MAGEMFYDRARIMVQGGDGGNGVVAFRREKYVPLGGPAGGDGGRGGDIILSVDQGLRTLVDFKYRRHYRAERGEHGSGKHQRGRNGEDLVLRVPPGTLVRQAESGELLADLVGGEGLTRLVVARGGRGGKGNARFASARDKAPGFAEKGEPGEELWLELELRLLAEVGLIGFPNAGKSTLLSRLSAARPKVGDYPFTTLVPQLGVVTVPGAEGRSFVAADIPGLIEGAHAGAGLGHDFLRHVERTRVLVHVLDAGQLEGRLVEEDVVAINRELELYHPALAGRPQVLAANKMDLPQAAENLQRLRDAHGNSYRIFPLSAVTGQGVGELVGYLAQMLAAQLEEEASQPQPEAVSRRVEVNLPAYTIKRQDGVFLVEGREVERRVVMTDWENEEGIRYLQRGLEHLGLFADLRKAGARPGDTVRIRQHELEFQE